MFARKIVPILLVAGAVHMMMHHSQRGCEDQPGDKPAEGGHAHGPQFRHGPFGYRGELARVPPMFEMLHNRAHAAQAAQAAQQPPSAAPAV